MSATTRTLKCLRDSSFTVDVCERFLSFAGKFGQRKDLFGLFDLIAMHPTEGIYGIQCFTTAWKQHEDLFTGDCKEAAQTWLDAGGKIELWGWRKLLVKRGGVARTWQPRVKTVTSENANLIISELEIWYVSDDN